MLREAVVSVFLIALAGAQCPGNGDILSYGDSCQYKCHCHDNQQCDVVTGECPLGCALGWMGPGCQYVNHAFDKIAVQSATYTAEAGNFGPDQAVDGDDLTCSRATSTVGNNPSWSVDLGEMRYITGLVFTVPVKSPAILDAYDVFVSNETFADDADLETCYWQQASEDTDSQEMKYEITCFQPTYGQFVIVRKRSATPDLELCEAQVYGGRELAFKKPSVQSSTLQPMNEAGLANDGQTSGADILQCSITHETAEPYWQVDLGQVFTISQVVIHNSHDQYAQSLNTGFEVSIKEEAAGVDLFQHVNDGTVTHDMVVSLAKPVDGRYVTITLPGNSRQLILCEMEVFGDCPENHCNMDCSANCWCNTTVTGTAQIAGICPYMCSDQADVGSYPQCDIQSADSVISGNNMDVTVMTSAMQPENAFITTSSGSEMQTTITIPGESEMLSTTTSNEEAAAVETSSEGDVTTTATTMMASTSKDTPTSAPDNVEESQQATTTSAPDTEQDNVETVVEEGPTENPIKFDEPVLPVLPIDGVCPPSEDGEPTFGDQCQYRCHCEGGAQCLSSGGCPTGHCAAGWNGGSCQYDNLAIFQTASQESTASKGSTKQWPINAVDSSPHGTCSQTNPWKQTWWTVDLGENRYVAGTIITVPFLPGKFGPHLDNFTIYVSNDSDITSPDKVVCYEQSQNYAPWYRVVLEFLCFEPIWGRYVTVQQQEDYKDLHICDFVVYGGRELSFRKPVSFSSKLSITPTQHQAMFGVEYTDTLCTSTEISQDPWWTIDLGQTYTVQRIKVHLAQNLDTREEMSDFRLRILSDGDKKVTYEYSAEGSSLLLVKEVSLSSPADGRYVMIELLGESRQLSLCGVDVFGDCPVDRCYLGCDQDCFCNSIITGISKDNAICPYGCGERAFAIGDSQNICHKRCDDSQWGVLCSTLCGSCLDGEPCNVENGNCENGCAPGFIDPPLCVTPSLIPIVPDTDVGETDSNVDDVADAPVKVTVKTTPAPVLEPVDDNVKTDPGQTETDDVTAVDDGVGSPGPVNEIEEPDTNGDSENDFETPGHESEEDINLEIEDGSFDTKSSTDDKSHPDMPPMDTDGKNLDAAEVNSPDLGMPGKESILTGKDTVFSERQENKDSGSPGSSSRSVYNSETIIFVNAMCLLVLLICSK